MRSGVAYNNNGTAIALLATSFIAVMVYSRFSISVMVVVLAILFGIFIQTRMTKRIDRGQCSKLLLVVTSVYLISACFFSYAFEDGKYFLMLDPTQYFRLLNMQTMDMDPSLSLFSCYFLLDDRDALHELFVRYCILFANNQLTGASVIYLTLINTLFGVLSIGAVYRIMLKVLPATKAYRYALLFALLSPFHFYSVSCVRDIIIACIYAHTIEIILGDFKVKKLALLLVFFVLAWGVRLYSGLFLATFIAYYIFCVAFKRDLGKYAVIGVSALLLLIILPQINQTEVYTLSVQELESYEDYDKVNASSSSLARQLTSLPPVVKQVALFIHAQMMPFPPFNSVPLIKNMSHAYMELLVITYEIFWFIIAFSLIYMLLFRGCGGRLTFNDWVLIGIYIIFILLNTAQLDVRRIMAIYPLLLYYYVKVKFDYLKNVRINVIHRNVGIVYVVLLLLYMIVKA